MSDDMVMLFYQVVKVQMQTKALRELLSQYLCENGYLIDGKQPRNWITEKTDSELQNYLHHLSASHPDEAKKLLQIHKADKEQAPDNGDGSLSL